MCRLRLCRRGSRSCRCRRSHCGSPPLVEILIRVVGISAFVHTRKKREWPLHVSVQSPTGQIIDTFGRVVEKTFSFLVFSRFHVRYADIVQLNRNGPCGSLGRVWRCCQTFCLAEAGRRCWSRCRHRNVGAKSMELMELMQVNC